MNEESLLNTLSVCHEQMKRARVQETKDSTLCQLVLSLFPYVPSQEARDKIGEILREYNAEERIPEQDKIHILIDDVFLGQMRQSLENLELADKTIRKSMSADLAILLLGGIVTLKELIEKCE